MQNEDGNIVDMYIPRRWCVNAFVGRNWCDLMRSWDEILTIGSTATNALITPKDHASVQISVAKTDDNGRMTGESDSIAFSGMIRSQGEADAALYRIAKERGLLE